MVTHSHVTVTRLFDQLEQLKQIPLVEGQTLKLSAQITVPMRRSLQILHTGVLALMTDREWYGCSCVTGWSTHLNLDEPIPGWISHLCVAGDQCWFRLPLLPNDVKDVYFSRETEPRNQERFSRSKSVRNRSHLPRGNSRKVA